jgi:hypothetical protein
VSNAPDSFNFVMVVGRVRRFGGNLESLPIGRYERCGMLGPPRLILVNKLLKY